MWGGCWFAWSASWALKWSCLPLSPIVSGCLPSCWGWVLVGVVRLLRLWSGLVSCCLPSCGGWLLAGVVGFFKWSWLVWSASLTGLVCRCSHCLQLSLFMWGPLLVGALPSVFGCLPACWGCEIGYATWGLWHEVCLEQQRQQLLLLLAPSLLVFGLRHAVCHLRSGVVDMQCASSDMQHVVCGTRPTYFYHYFHYYHHDYVTTTTTASFTTTTTTTPTVPTTSTTAASKWFVACNVPYTIGRGHIVCVIRYLTWSSFITTISTTSTTTPTSAPTITTTCSTTATSVWYMACSVSYTIQWM